VDLGFHQDPPKEQQTDKKTLELRRRIFYCVYSLDRQVVPLWRAYKSLTSTGLLAWFTQDPSRSRTIPQV